MKRFVRIAAVVAALVVAASGASAKKVKTLKAGDKSIDSEFWTDSDIRMVVNHLIKECGESQGVTDFIKERGRLPRVFIEPIVNKTASEGRLQEKLNTRIIENFFRNAVINNRNLTIMANAEQREKLAEEHEWQKENADEDSLQEGTIIEEDFDLQGTVELNWAPGDKYDEKSYQVTLELIRMPSGDVAGSFQNNTEETAVRKLVKHKK